MAGRRPESDEALKQLEEKYPVDSAFQIAAVHATRRETDAAFSWLERGYSQRDAGLPQVKCEPTFRSLHNDPRWSAFLKKMGLAG